MMASTSGCRCDAHRNGEMKATVRELTRRLGIYKSLRRVSDMVKWSKSFERLHDATHPRQKRAKQAEFDLFRSLVPPGSLCFDIGANIGEKTRMYLAHGCRVVAVEPVERNIEILEKRFGRTPDVTIVSSAASDHVGREAINVIDDVTAFSSFSNRWVASLEDPELNRFGVRLPPSTSQMVDMTTLDLLIERFGSPDYVKVDVEGHEINVLRSLSQKVTLVSFEANLPEFADETINCVSTLATLAPASVFNYTDEGQDDLKLAEWIDAAAFQERLESTHERFMEIYCRMC